MSYESINSKIADEKLLKSMVGIENSNIKVAYLLDATLEILSDNSSYLNIISERNKIALCNLCIKVASTLAGASAFKKDTEIKKACEYSMKKIYYTEAPNGKRIATKGEINNGVTELTVDVTYPAGEDVHRKLNTLGWILFGDVRYIYALGFKVKYNDRKEVVTPTYDIIAALATDINSALEWYSTMQFDKALKIIQKFSKAYKNIYIDSVQDEIKESISVEQITKDILDRFPKGSNNIEYRRAIAISLKYRNKNKLTPMEIKFIREQHRDFNVETSTDNESNNEIKIICNNILKAVNNGEIKEEELGVKIAKGLVDSQKWRVSTKQLSVITKLNDKINKPKNEDSSEDIDSDDYSGIGDILEI